MAPAGKGRKEAPAVAMQLALALALQVVMCRPAAGQLGTFFSTHPENIDRGQQPSRHNQDQGACRLCLTRLFPNETDMPPATLFAADNGARGIIDIPGINPRGIIDIPGINPRGIIDIPGSNPRGIIDIPGANPRGIIDIPGANPRGIIDVPHTNPRGIIDVPHTNPRGIIDVPHRGAAEGSAKLSPKRSPKLSPKLGQAVVVAVTGQAEKMVLKGGKAVWAPLRAGDRLGPRGIVRTGLRSGVELRLPDGRFARLGSATKMGIGGFNGGQVAAPFALMVKYGSVALGRKKGPAGASKPLVTVRSGQSLLPAGGANLTPAAMGRERSFPAVKAGSRLTRLSRASRGVAKLNRMRVTRARAVSSVTPTGARGVQAAPTGGTVGISRSPRPTGLGR